ncbi:hypothetical protein BDA96_01G205800 [Sorghum bicolor]|uniref:Uncharacterized protein n=2 Tax=Sorghum bicolor TaxID=4558 RepID=A0A921RZ68_SORBI|nr:hypothetical protein BDA96_01G205800 [Sorghum bicolor]KXG25935.2 hypothetical protein SORBI_3006G033380 [Sorghum bicolor]
MPSSARSLPPRSAIGHQGDLCCRHEAPLLRMPTSDAATLCASLTPRQGRRPPVSPLPLPPCAALASLSCDATLDLLSGALPDQKARPYRDNLCVCDARAEGAASDDDSAVAVTSSSAPTPWRCVARAPNLLTKMFPPVSPW